MRMVIFSIVDTILMCIVYDVYLPYRRCDVNSTPGVTMNQSRIPPQYRAKSARAVYTPAIQDLSELAIGRCSLQGTCIVWNFTISIYCIFYKYIDVTYTVNQKILYTGHTYNL
jgi:hypothetical protein